VFLSKGVKHCTTLTLQPSLIKPSIKIQFSSVCRILGLSCVPLDHHSVSFGHCQVCSTTNTFPFSWKHSGCKHSQICSLWLLLLTRIWPPHRFQIWNNFQSHQPFCLLADLRHLDGEWWDYCSYFSSTWCTNIWKWRWDVVCRSYIYNRHLYL
jgi:hypothetical protein